MFQMSKKIFKNSLLIYVAYITIFYHENCDMW